MPTENFLINPPRRIRRKNSIGEMLVTIGANPKRRIRRRSSRRKNSIGEMLVTIGANPKRGTRMRRRTRSAKNPWYGDPQGHRIAALMRWGKIKRGKVSTHRRRRVVRHAAKRVKHVVQRRQHVKGRWAPAHIRRKKKMAQQAFWVTKYGHMLAHPRSKKVYTRKGFITMRRRKRNSWFGQPVRHRRAAKKGWRRGHKIGRRRIRHNPEGVLSNPRRRRHSGRRRRNPMLSGLSLGKLTSSLTNVRSWAPLAMTGALSAITGAVAPSMIGFGFDANPWSKIGVQLVVAVGGGLVVEKFVDARHGQAWMVVGVSMVGYQLLKQFVLVPYLPQFAVGLGSEYMNYYPDDRFNSVSQDVGAFPQEVGAFPSQMNDYPGVGGADLGAYPYDGSPY